eukprot:m51a1_g8192 hypothetical protein (221) ;mRNA; f:1201-1939
MACKVVVFNSSPHVGGNTDRVVQWVVDELVSAGIAVDVVRVGGPGVTLSGCSGCGGCANRNRCVKNDPINDYYQRMLEADGIVLASPVHFANMNAEMKALVDRCGIMAMRNGRPLARKVGAAVCATGRAGGVSAAEAMGRFFGINGLVVPGSTYWPMAFGLKPGDVESDAEGRSTMVNLGQNIAWLLRCIHPDKFERAGQSSSADAQSKAQSAGASAAAV